MSEHNNIAWSVYRLTWDGYGVHATFDPRCPWCTMRRSFGHYEDCARPGAKPALLPWRRTP